MKKSTKLVILLVFAIIFATMLASCHGASELDEFEIPESFDESKEYEISFWVKIDNNTAQRDIYLDAISDFEKIYPNIKVTLRQFFNYDDIYKEVLTNIQTKTPPNVCITYPDHIVTYNTGVNLVVPLDELMADEKYGLGGSEIRFDSVKTEEIYEKFLLEGQIGEKQYALPFMRSTEACYINEDLVRELGYSIPEDGMITWDFVFEVSRAALVPKDYDEDGNPIYVNGQKVMVPFIYKSTDNMMIQMLKQKGYGYSTDDGEILLFGDDTKQILYMLAEERKAGSFTTFDIENAYPGDLINQGKCIFGVDSTAGATWIGTNAPNVDIDRELITDFNLRVTPIPQFDTQNPKMISQGPSICLFNSDDDDEVLASWLFMQFLLTNEVQIAYSQTEGYAPVTSKARNTPEYVDYLSRGGEDNGLYYKTKIDATRLLLDNVDNTFITPVFNGSASLRKSAGWMIEDIGKSVDRKIEINDNHLQSTFKKAQSMFKVKELWGKRELGKMPATSVILISSIGVIWVGMGVYVGIQCYKRYKKRKD